VHREKLARLGVRAPKGVLLCGPPGCSKTVLVRATATESGVNFVAIRGPEVSNSFLAHGRGFGLNVKDALSGWQKIINYFVAAE